MTAIDTTAGSATWPTEPSAELVARVRSARAAGVRWLVERVGDDGTPQGSDVSNAWWRAPWALCVGGAPDAAAAMMGWVEREALDDDGDLRAGSSRGSGPGSPVYHLSPLAIAAWLLGRYDTAAAVNDRLAHFQDPVSGGAYEFRDFDDDALQDTLQTGQLGISALVTGRRDIADGVFTWLERNYQAQPELPHRLYSSWRGESLVTEVSEKERFQRVLDFQAPRQAYFHPGIAGAFLAGYAQQTGRVRALNLGLDYLALSQQGTAAQFDDPQSVQICKFGWGAAAMHTAAPASGQLPWVVRMAEWFVRRQRSDGAWAPSAFITPDPGLLDLYWKTAEHVMELSYIELALSAGARS